ASLVRRDRDMVHPGGTSVGGDLTERRVEGGAFRKRRSLGAGFLCSRLLDDNRRFPTPSTRGTTMAKPKPRRRPKPKEVPQPPRDRLAEIRAEIRDVPQPIETRRRVAPVIRTGQD